LEQEEDGSEMERLEKSNVAFFTGLSLISSLDGENIFFLKTTPFIK
jgi:hypothetical protein